jgi:hypothetical protein
LPSAINEEGGKETIRDDWDIVMLRIYTICSMEVEVESVHGSLTSAGMDEIKNWDYGTYLNSLELMSYLVAFAFVIA